MSEVPQSIFKYLAPERVDILENEKIAFTPPDRFNDLLDVKPRVEPLIDRNYLGNIEREANLAFIESLPTRQRPKTEAETARLLRMLEGATDHFIKIAPEMAKKWQDELPKLISSKFGVLCLSETKDDHVMWAHYAAEHKGFVLEFDPAEPDFQRLGDLRKVEYLPHRPVYDPAQGANGFWRQKTNAWAYEREWRIVRELENCETLEIKGTNIYLTRLRRSCVKSVYLGIRASSETEDRVRAAVGTERITIYRSRLDDDSEKLVFIPIQQPEGMVSEKEEGGSSRS